MQFSSHASPPLNPAYAQHMKYKCPNHSNHRKIQLTYLIQQHVLRPSTCTYYQTMIECILRLSKSLNHLHMFTQSPIHVTQCPLPQAKFRLHFRLEPTISHINEIFDFTLSSFILIEPLDNDAVPFYGVSLHFVFHAFLDELLSTLLKLNSNSCQA